MPGLRIGVIGGGIVGLASAFRAGQAFPDAVITVYEKESAVAVHQTGNNSGVLHCGLQYKPGTVKARVAVDGIRQMIAFCQENGVAHEVCGKLVVATNELEAARMKDLMVRGTRNGLRGLRELRREEIGEFEPHAAGIAALHVPEEGIADYPGVAAALAGKISGAMNGRVVLNARVRGLHYRNRVWQVETTSGDFENDVLVNCAGLHCDRVSALAGEKREMRIVPFRGEYYRLRKAREYLVRNLIYPVPDPTFPFLGVHFTRMVRGGIEAGPNAVLAFAREGYKKTDVNLADLFDALSYKGLWRFLAKYPAVAWMELRRSFSKSMFCRSLQKLVPELTEADLEDGGAGVRSQAMSPEGDLVHDFAFVVRNRAVQVLNAPSPAATAALAIGEVIAGKVREAAEQ